MKRIVLTDGGMGQELLRRAGGEPHPLWSAQVLIERPDLVAGLHADFIAAGARVITINTYSATPERLEREGVGGEFERLQRQGYDLAAKARDEAGVDGVRIAACLPPLFASYRPDMAPDYEQCLALYRRIVAEQEERCDFMLCETLASLKEIRAAATAAKESAKPVWVAMTVRDDGSGLLRGGETLDAAHAVLDEIGVEARLLNCSRPEAIAASWNTFAIRPEPLGAYANGFTTVAPLQPGGTVKELKARRDLGPDEYARFALGWAAGGAAIVGGCCEVGPEHIARLHAALREAGYSIGGDIHG